MAEPGRSGRLRKLRPLFLLILLAAAGWLIWRATHRPEGYAGGDIVTTGTIEATSVSLAFQVGGRIAAVPVVEGDRVHPDETVARLDPSDLEVELRAARAALENRSSCSTLPTRSAGQRRCRPASGVSWTP